jgi:hypothetical protein
LDLNFTGFSQLSLGLLTASFSKIQNEQHNTSFLDLW